MDLQTVTMAGPHHQTSERGNIMQGQGMESLKFRLAPCSPGHCYGGQFCTGGGGVGEGCEGGGGCTACGIGLLGQVAFNPSGEAIPMGAAAFDSSGTPNPLGTVGRPGIVLTDGRIPEPFQAGDVILRINDTLADLQCWIATLNSTTPAVYTLWRLGSGIIQITM
jgi:hypothetical protein